MISRRNRNRPIAPAIWSHRIGLFSVPVLVISVLGFRMEMITVPVIYHLLAAAWILAVAGVLLAIWAFVRIWTGGVAGFGRALRGLFYGLLSLSIPLLALGPIFQYPALTDISTNPEDPPQFRAALEVRPKNANPLPRTYSPDHVAAQRQAYSDIVTRRFDVEAAHLFAAVRYVVASERWQVLDAVEPLDTDGDGRIEAVAHTLLFRFPDDIVITTGPDPLGSRLDMRSASRFGRHDLGANAARIREFIDAVEEALLVAPLEYDPSGV